MVIDTYPASAGAGVSRPDLKARRVHWPSGALEFNNADTFVIVAKPFGSLALPNQLELLPIAVSRFPRG
jgi:hypothetical protein